MIYLDKCIDCPIKFTKQYCLINPKAPRYTRAKKWTRR